MHAPTVAHTTGPATDHGILSFARRTARWSTVALLAVATACGPKSDDAAAGASAAAPGAGQSTTAATSDTGMAGMDHSKMAGMAPMGGATGDPDRDFLRMMSEHHKGMIAMAHLTIEEKKGSATAQADAEKIDTKQDAELDSMVTMLEQQFKDPYDPKIMPDNQKMVDELKPLSGSAYDRMFYHHVVQHHQQATQMIDQHLPMLKDAKVRAMAERMKRDQTREIEEFQRKASATP
ncbi:MAG: DUF305 domain-containing protein [Gemmatimonadaceae bacterium]|uniref:DUF305 domain-containing protein n=1 Tax=Gemmatimonas sp. UBA7669 TaxID=1946568 RepID=UPI0025C3BEED|nr:DUF305 domain-containing protein [Gemmatimonas sp. UBA7669]MBX9854833.1 DUF305 domain-containing protein [Gemmatimonadaceae bacterium]